VLDIIWPDFSFSVCKDCLLNLLAVVSVDLADRRT